MSFLHPNAETIAKLAISPYENFCTGFLSVTNPHYYLAVNLAIGKTKRRFGHSGSSELDSIVAFDAAEVENLHLGQINLVQVSSFCGPEGILVGYDVFQQNNLCTEPLFTVGAEKVTVYSLEPLIDAARSIFGTVSEPKFPMLPGSFVPCAGKQLVVAEPSTIYSAIAIGIPTDRATKPILLMEDVGTLSCADEVYDDNMIHQLHSSLAGSVLAIGEIQHIEFGEIFVGHRASIVDSNEVGCALVIAPYFHIAKKALTEYNTSELHIGKP